jgi:iron-sulfur cluster insertion protein
MEMHPSYQQLDAPLEFTPAAAAKVASLIAEEEQAEDDLALQRDGVTLLVDPLSLQYLMGAEVDYRESLQGAQFVIRNPNAKTTCGCGSSFSA